MTDLEITRLCAEAMRFIPYRLSANGVIQESGNGIYIEDAKEDCGYSAYKPLYDDAQALALMRMFKLGVVCFHDSMWSANDRKNIAYGVDLNRVICECVAKMQQAKA